ncbi:MAG: fumarylacetoacetate hydrolase family protein [Actinomycetota bacterium]|nr:fumarylacetoacetate hydrolase family protein [Actinomycetota bacterium]
MRFVTFDPGAGPRPGALVGEEIADLSPVAHSIEDVLATGRLGATRDALKRAERFPAASCTVLAPLRPASLRDFLAFEDHAKGGARRRNEELNPSWYEIPVYYKGNHREILGPGENLLWPAFTDKLDFELELACVVGERGRDLDETSAGSHIAGYTIMNDWSARDVQRREMAMRLGPAKSKDFATSLGPVLVTADEIDPRDGLKMTARVNGEIWCEANSAAMHWTFPQMISYVSRGETVYPGDVYGSGTPFGGCGLDQDRWLRPGDTVDLEIEGIGVLSNTVVR